MILVVWFNKAQLRFGSGWYITPLGRNIANVQKNCEQKWKFAGKLGTNCPLGQKIDQKEGMNYSEISQFRISCH